MLNKVHQHPIEKYYSQLNDRIWHKIQIENPKFSIVKHTKIEEYRILEAVGDWRFVLARPFQEYAQHTTGFSPVVLPHETAQEVAESNTVLGPNSLGAKA